MPAPDDNRKGYWESDGLKRFHDALLQSAGTRWDDFTQFNPGWLDFPAASRFEAELEALLNQEFPVRDIFFVKDPRIARFLPFWLGFAGRYGIAAKIVIPLRNPLEVAASLQKARRVLDTAWIAALVAPCARRGGAQPGPEAHFHQL